MYQQITIIGNLGRDPEMRYTQEGVAVCSFSVAVNKNRQVNGQWVSDTTWIKVSAWRDLAERLNEQLAKGQQVFVVGEAKVDAYIGKDGQAHGSLEVTARTVRLLGGRGDASGESSSGADIPF